MNTFMTFIPLIVVLGIGLVVVINLIIKDRKQAINDQPTEKYSNFWLRLLSFFIDFIILSIISYIIIIYILNLEIKNITADFGFFILYKHPVAIIISWLYYSLLESSKLMGTFGKAICQIKVSDMKGNKISFLNATGRFFAKFLSSIILFMGFLMMIFMSKKQCLHDVLADTIVTKRQPHPTLNQDNTQV